MKVALSSLILIQFNSIFFNLILILHYRRHFTELIKKVDAVKLLKSKLKYMKLTDKYETFRD